MSYGFLTDDELYHELELTAKQFERTRQQLERLIAMKSEGKVSDDVFQEVLEEITNKLEAYRPKHEELRKVSAERTTLRRTEAKGLGHDLESLEVRYAIGSIPEDQYKVNRTMYLMRIQEIEQFTKGVDSLSASMSEDMERCLSIVSQYKRIQVKEEPVARAPAVEIPEVERVPKKTTTPPPSKSPPAETKREPRIKICSRCGAENPETSLYCYNCGAKLT